MRVIVHTSLVIGCGLLAACDGALADDSLAPTPLAAIEIEVGVEDAPSTPDATGDAEAEDQEPAGKQLGTFKMTYYWVAKEGEGRRSVTVYDKRCKPLARVTRKFARKLRLEGSGHLRDGRLLTTAGGCKCGSTCYWAPDESHRWGAGVKQRPLSPFRSIAVDTRHVAIGQTLYVPELDGLTMPGSAPHGGFVHDGCVIADDKGGGVRGRQIDFFAARRTHYEALFKRHRIKRVKVYDGGERCRSLAEGANNRSTAASGRGSI